MCERKAKKDALEAVVSLAACVSGALPVDAIWQALSGWGRPAWSLRQLSCSPSLVFCKPRKKQLGRVAFPPQVCGSH